MSSRVHFSRLEAPAETLQRVTAKEGLQSAIALL
jgi:hypothetical protein